MHIVYAVIVALHIMLYNICIWLSKQYSHNIYIYIYEIDNQYTNFIQNSENNNCERHEVNDQFGSLQLQFCNHRQPMK